MKFLMESPSVAPLNLEGREILSPFGSPFYGASFSSENAKVNLTTWDSSYVVYLVAQTISFEVAQNQ